MAVSLVIEAATLDEARQGRLLAFVEQLKAGQAQAGGITMTAGQLRTRDEIAAALASIYPAAACGLQVRPGRGECPAGHSLTAMS